MATFPTLSSGQPVMYPVERTRIHATRVHRFLDASEQRYRQHMRAERFTLTYQHLTYNDMAVLQDFFDTTKGAFDTSWELLFDGTLYSKCTFVDDAFIASDSGKPNLYNVSLRVRCRQPG